VLEVRVAPDGYARHDITSDLVKYPITMQQCCPIEILAPQPYPGLRVRVLLKGVSSSWGERVLADDTKALRYNPRQDVAGPVVMAVVAEPASPSPYGKQTTVPSQGMGPRLVVIGSSLSFTNAFVEKSPANLYFLQNAINWLAGKTHLLGIPPKGIDVNLVVPLPEQMRTCRWIFLGLVPACFFVLGIAVWLVRRR